MATQRILVKAASGLRGAQLTLGAAAVNFTVSPLFKSIGQQAALGATSADVWQILTPPPGFAEENAWDVCHSLMQQGIGIAGTSTFAEPDLEQQWITGRNSDIGMMLAKSCANADPQSEDFPRIVDNPFWFRDSDHSQFDAAIAAIGGPDVASKVRIAHFDTGYDPEHRTLPKRMRTDMARNFIDDTNPNDARDQTDGPLNNLGHGTGTLSILAGSGKPGELPLGGAPFAEIVPVRVANRVVLFSNSAIAQAFDYVHALNANAGKRIDIVTMSMGGLASQAWADAVNALYEQGVFIVTAAGNNFGNLPTHNIVYPARFGRVVAACGVMANGTPYADLGIQLNGGKLRSGRQDEHRGGCGDAECAMGSLGLQGHRRPRRCRYVGSNATSRGFSRTLAAEESCRCRCLSESLDAGGSDPRGPLRQRQGATRRLGRGVLRSNNVLSKAPAAASALRQTEADTASFAFLRVLTGLGLQAMPSPQQQMLELEALQLSQSTAIEAIMPADPQSVSPADLQRLAEALAAHPRASKALREALRGAARPAQASVPAKLPFGRQCGRAVAS